MIRKYIIKSVVLVFFLSLILAGCSGGKAESVSVDSQETQEESSLKPSPELDEPSSVVQSESPKSGLESSSEPVSDAESEKNVATKEELDEWLGAYWSEYTVGLLADGVTNAAYLYALKIYEDNGEYRAYFAISGRMVGYLAKATVQGNEEEICILYEECIHCSIMFLDKEGQEILKNGDILFTLKRTDLGIETVVGEAINKGVYDITFKQVETEEEYKSIDGQTLFME